MSSININTARDFYLAAKHPINGLLVEVEQLRKMSTPYRKDTEVRYEKRRSFAYETGHYHPFHAMREIKKEYDVWGDKFIVEMGKEEVVPVGAEFRDMLTITFYGRKWSDSEKFSKKAEGLFE